MTETAEVTHSDEDTLTSVATPEDAERNIETILRMVRAEHFFDYGEDAAPSLKRSGCDLVAAAFNITIVGAVARTHEDFEKIRIYYAEGRFTMPGASRFVEAQGSCGTDEPCFTSRKWISTSEMLSQARSKADTRMWNDAIRRLLGISSITWADLERIGIRRGDVMRKKGSKADPSRGRESSPPPTQDQRPQQPPQPQQTTAAKPAAQPPMTDVQKGYLKTYCDTLSITSDKRGELLTAAGWQRGSAVSAATAAAVLAELARMCKAQKIDNPVTGEVHSPPAAQPSSAPADIDDDIPF